MHNEDPRDFAYPNIVFKKKLAPLPLFSQNLSPKCPATPKKANTWFTPKNLQMTSPSTMKASSTQSFLHESRTINNYGRICDQPFLEYSNFHSSQLLGSGQGKKVVRLDPIEWKHQRKQIAFNRKNKSAMSTPTLPTIKVANSPITITVQDKSSPKYSAPQVIEADEGDDDNVSRIEGTFNFIDHEVHMSFVSLDVVVYGFASQPVTVSLGKNDLKKIYKQPANQIAQMITNSVVHKHGKLKIEITSKPPSKSSERFGDQSYPETKEDLSVIINNKPYRASIIFPHLEASIATLDYKEKIVLNPGYLANLFENEFENMQDYLDKFNIPTEINKTQDEILNEELKALPVLIKKVIKTDDFGGLLIFKTMELHVKNTSETETQASMVSEEDQPESKSKKRRPKNSNNTILKLSVYELSQVLKCNVKELVHLIRDSIKFEEGKGLVLELDSDLIREYGYRSDVMGGHYPASVDKFMARVNNSEYQVEIKFPTLELYIPETSYRDVIQLTPTQLEDLMADAFKNMEEFMQCLKAPSNQVEEYRSSISPEPRIKITETKDDLKSGSKIESPRTVQSELLDERSKKNSIMPPEERSNAEELKGLSSIIKKVIKTDEFGGLLLFKNLEVVLKNTSIPETTETVPTEEDNPSYRQKKQRKPRDPIITAKISIYQLSQILNCNVKEFFDLVKNSLKSEDGKTFSVEFDAMKLNLYNSRKEAQFSPTSDASEKFQLNACNSTYEAFIRFPTLELYVPETGFRDVIVLNAAQLEKLVENSFENLEDYLKYLKSPPVVKEEEHKATNESEDNNAKRLQSLKSNEELQALPNFLKKVIKTDEFGGLLIFKNLEVSLKSLSATENTETLPTEEDNASHRQKKVRKPREPNLVAKISVLQLSQLLKCNIEEVVGIIKVSIKSEDGKNFTVELDDKVLEQYAGRSEDLFNPVGEVSEKFEVNVNGSVYEAFIRFPTLELYVPESSFRDVIHLNAAQLNDLIGNSFENIEEYVNSLKKPTPNPSHRSNKED